MRFLLQGVFSVCLAAALAVPCASRAAEAAAAKRPNIVFVLADDLGWSDLACYGSRVHETPNLDRFAQQAVRFTDAYAAAPVCTPTRASLMTGKSPARLHMTIWREAAESPPRNRRLLPPICVANLPYAETTIANRLHDAGYLTALVGKWHLGDSAHYPEDFGFDVNVGGTGWGCPATYFYPYRGMMDKELRYVPHLEFGKPDEYLTDRLTDEALRIIDRAGEQPFFLYLAHHAVHVPLEAKPEDVKHCVELAAERSPRSNAVYAAMVRNLDENFGRLMAHLRRRGLAENTVVVFFSDNGGFIDKWNKQQVTSNAPLRSGKGSLYEGGIREPLLVLWPGVTPKEAVCHEPVISNDLFFTLLAAAGVTGGTDPTPEGLDIAPLLKNPAARLGRDALFFHYPHYYGGPKDKMTPSSAVRAGDWKLLEFFEDHRTELYNLRNDLSETTDLAPQMGDKARGLRDRLHAWLDAVQAQMPTENPAAGSSGKKRLK
jgi:arylsulfatase A-like enzyme